MEGQLLPISVTQYSKMLHLHVRELKKVGWWQIQHMGPSNEKPQSCSMLSVQKTEKTISMTKDNLLSNKVVNRKPAKIW